jgi:exopolysaccharide biosynthesis predicted pyruvyltransferase EpsI
MEVAMFIYVIVNSETLKIYVGQHKGTNLQKYLQTKQSNACHNSGTRSHLFAAMRKYSKESWSIHSLVSDVATRAELDEMERHFIRVLKAQHPDVGYNICDGGEGFTGPHSDESKQKLKDTILNRDPEVEAERRRKISEHAKVFMVGNSRGAGNKGNHYPKSEEFRRRVSQTLKGRILPAEVYRKSGESRRGLVYNLGNNWNVGRKQSQETIEKRKASNAGFKHSNEAKQKMKHPKSLETRQRMRDAQQARRSKEKS